MRSRSTSSTFGKRCARGPRNGVPANAVEPFAGVDPLGPPLRVAALGEQAGDAVDGRLGPARRAVEEDGEAAAGPQHTADLGERARAVEPVEGLGAEDGVDRIVGKRNLLGGAGERLRLGDGALEQGPHPGQRLDRDDAGEVTHQHPCQLAGAGGEVEHLGAVGQAKRGDRLLGPAGPTALVPLGGAVEARRERRLPRRQSARAAAVYASAWRKTRVSRSISRAITRRWISWVPS